jgi:DNA-binding LacI/PurR family transcriptional regulator
MQSGRTNRSSAKATTGCRTHAGEIERSSPSPAGNTDSPTYKWHQLKTLLRQRIERGDYQRDEVFCNQQELMDHHGVSYATVSRALSELVREGYLYRKRGVGTFVRPQEAPQRTSGPVGLLVWDMEHILDHPAFSRLVAGLSERLRAAGHNLAFIFANEKLIRSNRLADAVREARVCALVAPIQPSLTEASLRPLGAQNLPIVPLNLDFPGLSPCAVHFDLIGAIESATAHLLGCGYPRVALMVPDNEEAPWRIAGYRRALRAANVSDEVIFVDHRDRPLGPQVQHILAGMDSPLGLVANDDISALTAMRAAQDIGWSVPHRLGIVGVGNFLPVELSEIPLTTVHVPFDEMGRIAADMTLSLLAGRTPDPAVRHLAPRLVVRSTTTPVAACITTESRP